MILNLMVGRWHAWQVTFSILTRIMTGAVSIDDAWSGCGPAADVIDQSKWQSEAASHALTLTRSEQEGSVGVGVDDQLRASRRSTIEAERDAQEGSSGSSAERRKREERASQRLCQELARVRQQLDERDRTQSIVLYTALAVIIVLLIVVLQAFWKLQHATECLLWYTRRV